MRGTSVSRSRLRAAAILGGVPLLPPDPDLHERAFGAIFAAAKNAQCLYLHSVPTSSFLWRYLQESPWIREHFQVYLPDGVRMLHVVRLPDTFEAYLAKFKHKKRYNLVRQERLLRDHVDGRLELRRIERVDQVASFRDAVASVIRDAWQGKIATPEAYTILHDRKPFEDLAERGLFRSYVLDCAGTPSAFVLGYQFGDIYHYAEIAYSQAYARFSPGTTLLYLLIQDLIGHRAPRLLNFGIGDAVYKREFGNVQFQDASVLLLDRTRRFRVWSATWGSVSARCGPCRVLPTRHVLRRR
jgi:Acetyltransferase (GNAT) domain